MMRFAARTPLPLLYCLSRSVQKRVTPLLLTALTAAGLALFLTGSLELTLLGGGVTLVVAVLVICAQSYLRHADEFAARDPYRLLRR